jgi:hypothetical protein
MRAPFNRLESFLHVGPTVNADAHSSRRLNRLEGFLHADSTGLVECRSNRLEGFLHVEACVEAS